MIPPTTEESYEHFSGEIVGRPLVLTNKLTTAYQSYYLLLLSKTPSFITVQAAKQNIHHICPTFRSQILYKIKYFKVFEINMNESSLILFFFQRLKAKGCLIWND